MDRLAMLCSLSLLVAIVGGCATTVTGVYVNSPSVFGGRSIRIEENGQFSYFLWSDDRGEECEAHGTWSINEDDQGFIITRIKERKQSDNGGLCEEIPDIEKWKIGFNLLTRRFGEERSLKFRRKTSGT